MGYYTHYSLQIDSSLFEAKNEEAKETEIEAVKQSGMTKEMKSNVISLIEAKYADNSNLTILDVIEEIGHNPFDDSCKWYEHDEDMIQISEKYKNVLFTLTGTGEEKYDIWRKYYYNGKMQSVTGKVVYDSFDPAKLQ